MLSCSTKQVQTGHPLTPVPRSDLELERKDHQMSVQMAQAKIKAESVTDVQAATERMFTAINAAQPAGIPLRVVAARRRREVRGDRAGRRQCGKSNPRSSRIPELQELVERSRSEPPNVQPLTVIGSYRLF